MNLQEKETMVTDLGSSFKAAELAVVINYQGCTCAELTDLRKKLKPLGGKFAIVKNSLARRALADSNVADKSVSDALNKFFEGPTAVVWSGTDPVGPAKLVKEFAKTNEKFTVKAGVLGESFLSAKEVDSLASMPSREELLAKLLGTINAPATRLLQTINVPAQQLVRLLGAWSAEIEKKQ